MHVKLSEEEAEGEGMILNGKEGVRGNGYLWLIISSNLTAEMR